MTERPILPPACLVRGLGEMRAVLAHRRPATLLSAPGAACFLGPAGWRAMVRAALEELPAAGVVDILDCGDATGRALEALRLGQAWLVLRCDAPGADDATERALRLGAKILRLAPASLDLGLRGNVRRLAAWLEAGSGGVS